ncbi:MAG TPA: DUF1156 domain-containing protein, partial [Spirochaetia bacterium]|nr:DUF1156 domain-containing protein [Spirochaetia bacterium]
MPHRPFIETQFPLAVLSAESYKERKAGAGQTLVGIGKWWGRKPLVLVRSVLLGLLMPTSPRPDVDLEVFLRILTMDPDGLWRRVNRSIPVNRVAALLTLDESSGAIEISDGKARWAGLADRDVQKKLQRIAFNRMSYDERMSYCVRPEQIAGPSAESWRVINEHLGTRAKTLPELFEELSIKAFGRRVTVGDAFCGGGSIPFEASRLGLTAIGSDLNPVGALLTAASISFLGSSRDAVQQVQELQNSIWASADDKVSKWSIEHDSQGNRADVFLYCIEARSPATGKWVPLAPSWIISEKYRVIAELAPRGDRNDYDVIIRSGVSPDELKSAKHGTVNNSDLVCPETGNRYSIAGLRGPKGLRLWENDDLVPRQDDTFRERLYCIRWVTPEGVREYRSVTNDDLAREDRVLALLRERFAEWQEKGFIPSMRIAPGLETNRLARERGWTHWHHFFNPRQLLVNGLINSLLPSDNPIYLADVGRIANSNSRLTIWYSAAGKESISQSFSNQALNPNYNYAARSLSYAQPILADAMNSVSKTTMYETRQATIRPADARSIDLFADLWITDPPYADSINYHEILDFFLCWYDKKLNNLFPDWYSDGRPALAVKGTDDEFKRSMVEIYGNLAAHMPDDGLQVVMFTHQDAGVWADLGMILWAAGLKV